MLARPSATKVLLNDLVQDPYSHLPNAGWMLEDLQRAAETSHLLSHNSHQPQNRAAAAAEQISGP